MDSYELKEEIKRRIDIVELVSHYLSLQRAGRRMKACCPFHQEKTPSFYVDPERGFFECFGCGVGGDIFSFVQQIEGLEFPEAMELLAQRAGLDYRRATPADQKAGRERADILRANEAAMAYFRQCLNGKIGTEAQEYLAGRGISTEAVEAFGLGYAPDGWDNLLRHLAGKGLGERILQQAGLVKPRESGGYYDVFRRRLMFPIVDVSGRVLGFGGRTLEPGNDIKYLNTSETKIFRKGHTVYGLNLARQAVSDSSLAVLVEGYTDVIGLWQAGFHNVIACLGTAMTEYHLKLLRRYAREICFVFDADAAGVRAAIRSADLFENSDLEVRVAILPEGQDPDDCVRSSGPDAFRQCLEARVGLVEYQLRMIFKAHETEGPDGRMRAVREAVDLLLKVRDRALEDEYISRVADGWAGADPGRTEAMVRALRLEMQRRRAAMGPQGTRRRGLGARDRGYILESVTRNADRIPRRTVLLESAVLTCMLCNPVHLARGLSTLKPDDFCDPRHRSIAEALFPKAAGDDFDPGSFVESLPEEEGQRARGIELLLDDVEAAEEVFGDYIAKLRQYRQIRGLHPEYEVDVTEEANTSESEDETTQEDFEALRGRIQQAINEGRLSYDDPDYIRYTKLVKRFQGVGRRGYYDAAGKTALGRTPNTPSDRNGDDESG